MLAVIVILAQTHRLTSDHNAFRPAVRIVKQQVELNGQRGQRIIMGLSHSATH